jgi:hypothetical protein
MNTEPTTIITASDVTPECLQAAEEIFDGFFSPTENIDWWSFLDRLEAWGWCSPTVDSPAINKIKRHINKIKNQ